ncbi:MAG: ATPase domain-containing protein [Candidatus Micrarchaeota archaeon]
MGLLFPKVTSGIPGLDGMLGGGYTKNSIVAVAGSTGSGRTTFATQFLVEGYRQNKEPGLYLSFDEPKFSIFANMSGYDWNLPELEREKHVLFIEYPHNELGDFMEQESSLLELIDTLGVERVVFDSVTPLALLSEGDARRRELTKLVNTIRRWGVSALLTAEDMHGSPGDIPRTTVGIEALADGFIHLGWAHDGMRRTRTLEIVKMRGSAHEHILRPASISDRGFSLVMDNPVAPALLPDAGAAKPKQKPAKAPEDSSDSKEKESSSKKQASSPKGHHSFGAPSIRPLSKSGAPFSPGRK